VLIDPLRLSEDIGKIVCKIADDVELRKYFRFRGGRWYGGIATADCVGCYLKCVFCWSHLTRDNPHKHGDFYTPQQVFSRIVKIAEKRGYNMLRVSGGEPTISRDHLLQLLELVEQTRYTFILETNGILIGADKKYAQELSKYSNLHVRVSIKGCTPEEFSRLTGAKPDGFYLQLNSLRNLLNTGVSCHPAVMLSFSSKESILKLVDKLKEIDNKLTSRLEEEYVILYPHVVKLLKKNRIWPLRAITL